MLTHDEFYKDLDIEDRRKLIGAQGGYGYMETFRKYFNGEHDDKSGYEQYCIWWTSENTPLGKALK